jgi:hypothetical protein
MTKKFIALGKMIIPVSKKHKQSGTYTSFSSKKVMTNIQISFYPPTLGNPLYKEFPSENSESRVPKTNTRKG